MNVSKNDLIHLVGKRVICVLMQNDPQAIPSAMRGTVTRIDDLPQIHVAWDHGSSLALIPGVDQYRVLDERKLWVIATGSDCDGYNSGSIGKEDSEEAAIKSAGESNAFSDGISYCAVNEDRAISYCEDYNKDFNNL